MFVSKAKNPVRTRILGGLILASLLIGNPVTAGIWMDDQELASLPMSGRAWDQLWQEANLPIGRPDLSNQEDPTNVRVLAKALVHARTGIESLRNEVIEACLAAIGTEGGRTLALGRELAAYVLAADLVGLPPVQDSLFRSWLSTLLDKDIGGRTLRSTHEDRPNNWGTHAGASRLAVAIYLGDTAEIESSAQVFRGWLGDRSAYDAFSFGDLSWQCDPERPVAINPVGCSRDGLWLGGALPDELRRAGPRGTPFPKENYVYEALQGAWAQAVMLDRLGYDVFRWSDFALARATVWLYAQAMFPATGDDRWQIHLVNYYYGFRIPVGAATRPGKNMGWTGWTHGSRIR